MEEYPALSYYASHNYPRTNEEDIYAPDGVPMDYERRIANGEQEFLYPNVEYFVNPYYFQQLEMQNYWDDRILNERERYTQHILDQIDREKYYSKHSIENLRNKIKESTNKAKQIQKEIDIEYREYKMMQKQHEEEQSLVKENEYLREKIEQIKMGKLGKASSQLYLTSSLLD